MTNKITLDEAIVKIERWPTPTIMQYDVLALLKSIKEGVRE